MKTSNTKKLVESSIFIAMAAVLSVIKILDMPYGGSVTFASMLPIVIISYRHGIGWGVASGAVYGIIQQLLGLKNLSYVSSWQSILAVIFLDYILAFTVVGLAGAFRKSIKSQNAALVIGSFLASILRYVFHVIAGATVWVGLYIPTKAALVYSLGYNATYMIPETIVLLIAAYYVGSMLDFRTEQPMRIAFDTKSEGKILRFFGWFLIAGAFVFDILTVFGKFQNAESGEVDFSGLADISKYNIITMCVVSALALIVACVIFVYSARKKNNAKADDKEPAAK
jgi:thiamine transporter